MRDVRQRSAEAILEYLVSVPFEDCIAVSKEFRELPMSAGIYAAAELESLIIQAVNPPYNVRIPARE